MARYIAKNLVAAKLASRCEVQLSYGIGISKPLSIYVNTFGTSKYSDDHIINIIKENFDLSPKGIIETLNLKNINYLETAAYGHFGRKGDNFTWEKLDIAES